MIKNSGISGSSKSAKIDTSMSDTSENAVANKVIKRYVDTVRSYFEGKVPRQILIDITSVLPSATINRQIRDELYNIFTYTEGDDITTDPAWVVDTNGQHYIVRMLETETGVGFFIIGYEGFTRIEGDDTKTNQLLRDKIDREYVKDFLSQASFDLAKTHDYIVPSVLNYTTVEDSVGAGGRSVNFGIDLIIQDDIADAAEENDADLDNGVFHNGLVTAMGVKRYVNSREGMSAPVVEVEGSSLSQTIEPNKYYKFGRMTSLRIALGTATVGVLNHYMFEFTTPADSVPTITLSGVTWLNGDNILSHLEVGRIYQISIVNNLAVGGAF